jgi:hypothetical protein
MAPNVMLSMDIFLKKLSKRNDNFVFFYSYLHQFSLYRITREKECQILCYFFGLLYSRVGAGAARAESKCSPGSA